MLYALFSLIGIGTGFLVSQKLALPRPERQTALATYIVATLGVVAGAKLPVWISYGFDPSLILSGKSFMGGILGAFVALNLYKYFSGRTGDSFGGRFTIPLAVAAGFGKIGCWFNGCCAGDFFIPVQLVESGFHFAMAGALYLFYRRSNRLDLLFPLYLLAYLVMRFGIEFVRHEPRLWAGLTIYQGMALVFFPILATLLYRRRHLPCST